MESSIKPAIRHLIIALFGRLATDHGEPLIRATLSFITIAKMGVSETELNHMCSCEDEVLPYVYVCVYICTCTYIHVYVCTYVCVCVCVCVCVYIYIYI